jgi:hypothetical protein
MPSIYFHFSGQAHEIVLSSSAPGVVGRLKEALPAKIDIHCAKIAGKHIFWHAPFVCDLESERDVVSLPAGTFLYWPERQFLELIYGELQAEKAKVSVLGQLRGDLEWLRQLGRELVAQQGHRVVWASLTLDPDEPVPTDCLYPETFLEAQVPGQPLAILRHASKTAWQEEPEYVAALLQRKGVMLPYGPLAMAEGEFRKLQELLWRLHEARRLENSAARTQTAVFLLDAFVSRIDGLCGLHESGAVLCAAADALRRNPVEAPEIIQDLILYCGRIAAWLDLHIPWNALNESVRAAAAEGRM